MADQTELLAEVQREVDDRAAQAGRLAGRAREISDRLERAARKAVCLSAGGCARMGGTLNEDWQDVRRR